jgi:hypothetical protein
MTGKVVKNKQPRMMTRDDRELIKRALSTLLWSERESCVKVARDLYVIAGPDGKAQRFNGSWNDLRDWAATQPEKNYPLGLATYDRLEKEVDTLVKKLEAGNG